MSRSARVLLWLGIAALEGCSCGDRAVVARGDQPAVVVVDPEEVGRPRPAAESEPNDRARQAQLLPGDRLVEGSLGGPQDQDWYRIHVAGANQVLKVTVTGVSGGDVVLEAFSVESKRLARVDNRQLGEGEVLVNLGTTAGGDTLVRVQARKGALGSGSYRIGYELRAREEGEESEPNWKAELATPLSPEGEATGYLGWHTDTDWYRADLLNQTAGSRLRVEFDGVDDVRAGLAVHGADGRLMQERWGRRGESLILSNLVVPEGTSQIFVAVRCRNEANVESRYSVRVLASVPAGPTEAEPNDTSAGATPLPPGVAMAGLLPDASDVDLYRVSSGTGAPFRVQVIPPLGLDVALAVVDERGNQLYEANDGKAREAELLPVTWLVPPAALLRVRVPPRGEVTDVAPYHIKVDALTPGEWEREPNNAAQSATSWTPAAGPLRGYIHPKGDADFIRLPPSAGEQIVVQAGGLPADKGKLELLDEGGGRVLARGVPGREQGVLRLEGAVSPGTRPVLKISGAAGWSDPVKEYSLTKEGL